MEAERNDVKTIQCLLERKKPVVIHKRSTENNVSSVNTSKNNQEKN